MKVLIIGEHSYIGNSFMELVRTAVERKDMQHILDKVANRNWEIHKVRASSGEWREQEFTGYDVILHMAAIVHKKETSTMRKLYYEVNYKMALEVARKAKEQGVGQFVFLSTMAVYGDDVTCITKETHPNPSSLYGKSKLLAEEMLMQMNSESFAVSILRPPLVYGLNCPGNYGRLLWLSQWMAFFPKCENKRSMIHVDHLSVCIWLTIDRKITGILYPRDSAFISTSNLYQSMRREQGKQVYLLPINKRILENIGNKISAVKKLFGDCYYQFEMLDEKLNPDEYQIR